MRILIALASVLYLTTGCYEEKPMAEDEAKIHEHRKSDWGYSDSKAKDVFGR